MFQKGLKEPAGGRKPHHLAWVGFIHKQKFMELDIECTLLLYVCDPPLEKLEKHEELLIIRRTMITSVFLSVPYIPGIFHLLCINPFKSTTIL